MANFKRYKHKYVIYFLFINLFVSSKCIANEFTDVEHSVRKYFGRNVSVSNEPINVGESKDLKWKVMVQGKPYFIRKNTQLSEKGRFLKTAKLSKLFGEMGFSPKVHLIDEDKGILITDFIQGRMLTRKEIRDAGLQNRLIQIMHQIHHSKEALALYENTVDSVSKFKALIEKLKARGCFVPFQLEGAINDLAELIASHQFRARIAVAHRDLHRENILLDSSNKLWILDWETAKRADPYTDVVATVFLSQFNEREEQEFLKRYLGLKMTDKISSTEWNRYLIVKAKLLAKKALNTIEAFESESSKGNGLSTEEMKTIIQNGLVLKHFPKAHFLQVRLIRTLRDLRSVLNTPELQEKK